MLDELMLRYPGFTWEVKAEPAVNKKPGGVTIVRPDKSGRMVTYLGTPPRPSPRLPREMRDLLKLIRQGEPT